MNAIVFWVILVYEEYKTWTDKNHRSVEGSGDQWEAHKTVALILDDATVVYFKADISHIFHFIDYMDTIHFHLRQNFSHEIGLLFKRMSFQYKNSQRRDMTGIS